MSLNNNGLKGSCMRIPLLAALVYAYFCAPISLEQKAFVQTVSSPPTQNRLADGYDPLRDAGKDLTAASAEAQRSNKNILVEVGGEWCSWCHILDRFFDDHPDLAALRDKNYVIMKVSMSEENPNGAFLSRFPYVRRYPHIFILGARGNLIRSQPTHGLEDGQSYNAKRFWEFLERFAPKRAPADPR